MSLNFLSKKRKLKSCSSLYDKGDPKNINLNPFYYNYSLDEKNISLIEDICWNKNYEKSNKKLFSDKDFDINKQFIINNKPKKKNLFLNIKEKEKKESKNEEDYILYCLEMKKYSIKQIIELNQIRSIPNKKFNLILDIDLTMIKAVESNDSRTPRKRTDIDIKGYANNNPFQFFYRYRPYLFTFLKELKEYFNFYICTLSHINYANLIINDLKSRTGIIIPEKRIIAKNDRNFNFKKKKFINELIPLFNKDELNNTIIIDDNIYSWLKPDYLDENGIDTCQSIKCLIPSKRYIMDYPQNNEDIKFEILIYNNIYEKGFNRNLCYFFEVDYSYCIEKDSSVDNRNKFGQLYYIELFIKQCIKFSLFSGMSIVDAINCNRKKIFEDCKFNLKYLDNEWINPMSLIIKELGGTIVIPINEATHFILENKINSNKILNKNKTQKYVNVNYIIQCYLNLYKFNESDKKYKAIN